MHTVHTYLTPEVHESQARAAALELAKEEGRRAAAEASINAPAPWATNQKVTAAPRNEAPSLEELMQQEEQEAQRKRAEIEQRRQEMGGRVAAGGPWDEGQREVPPSLAMQQQRELELQRQHQMIREQQVRQQQQMETQRQHQLNLAQQQEQERLLQLQQMRQHELRQQQQQQAALSSDDFPEMGAVDAPVKSKKQKDKEAAKKLKEQKEQAAAAAMAAANSAHAQV